MARARKTALDTSFSVTLSTMKNLRHASHATHQDTSLISQWIFITRLTDHLPTSYGRLPNATPTRDINPMLVNFFLAAIACTAMTRRSSCLKGIVAVGKRYCFIAPMERSTWTRRCATQRMAHAGPPSRIGFNQREASVVRYESCP